MLRISFFILLLCICAQASGQSADIKEVKKEADRRFSDEDYDGAYKLYSQLVANFPKDAVYTYRLGVCMIYSEPDKKKALPYLKTAAAGEDPPPEAMFYLGKAYHVNYRFDEAISHYNRFKENAPQKLQKKLEVDREIEACLHGKRLLSNLTDLVVQNKKVLNEADYFRSYDLRNMGGKLLVKPDDFKTSLDKKKKEKSVMFLPKSGDIVYYSSYGENGDNGKDIYSATRVPGGKFSKPEPVPGINTPYDEDYPFLHPDGKTLYFASKGHNSMGGYDIFRSTYNERNGSWSPPVNLEFPINSPDDDFLFVTDSLQQTAYFSTGRQSPPGKIDVLKIKTQRKPIDVVVIAGTVEPEKEDQSVESSFAIKDLKTNRNISVISAEPDGSYVMELPNAGHLLFTVSTPGLPTQSDTVMLPLAKSSVTYRQVITYEGGTLKIINDFDGTPGDDNYLKYLAVIEKKAQLDVNEGENQLEEPLAETQPSQNNQGTTRPTVVSEEPGAEPPATVDNRELARLARQDAEESLKEAAQLETDAAEARRTGEEQKTAADVKLSEAAEAITQAGNVSDATERTRAIESAEEMMAEAKSEQIRANKVLALASTLEEDAKLKKQEAELNGKYADELDKVIVSANPASLQRLEELRQEIEELAASRSSLITRTEEIRNNLASKEEQAGRIEKINDDLRADLQETESAISVKEQELSATKKKKKRAAISEEIDNLKAARTEKENEIKEKEAELETVRGEIISLQTDLQIATGDQPATIVKQQPQKKPVIEIPQKLDTTPPDTTGPVTGAISTADPSEAESQLQALEQRISNDAVSAPPVQEFRNEEAQKLGSAAESAFADLSRVRSELIEAIAGARSALPAANPSAAAANPERLIADADALMESAQQLRQQARAASGEEKEKKNAEAAQKEEEATVKLIEASSYTAIENEKQFRSGDRFLQKLLSNGKGSEEDRSQAVELNGEAELALMQAAEIRMEAATLPTKGAILGNLSNAEEKEAEALLKQQQAIELLRASNPDVTQEEPAPDSGTDLTTVVSPVNSKLAELQAAERTAYTKALDARDTEIRSLTGSPGAAAGDLEKVRELQAQATALRTAPNAEIAEYKAALTKLDEAIVLLSVPVATEPEVTQTEEAPEEEIVPTVTPEPEKPVEEETSPELPVTTFPAVPLQDTTAAAQVFRQREDLLSSEQSKTTFNNALDQLSEAETALAVHETTSSPSEIQASDLNRRAEQLLREGDDWSAEAASLRQRAQQESGAEKETTLARAAALEERAQHNVLKAAGFTAQINSAQIAGNDEAINELIEKLQGDDSEKAALLREKVNTVSATRSQARRLRTEANTLAHPAQKLGGMENASEKENEILAVQEEVLTQLRQQYPDYSVPEPAINAHTGSPPAALLEKQSAALTSLTNAFNLEFEQARMQVTLTETTQKAFDKNAASKQLLVQAMREPDATARTGNLRQAARLSSEALAILKDQPVSAPVVATQTTSAPVKPAAPATTVAVTPKPVTSTATATPPSPTPRPSTARVEGLEVIRGNAYNTSRPIPFDKPAGEGLIFRVQIGAFRNKLPDDAFRGLSPLNGETTTNGYFRYTAGNFNKFENANAVKNDLRNLGYSDAFVVAYYNGKRISASEALAILEREGRTINPSAPQSAGITANTNIPRQTAAPESAPASIAGELGNTNGLLYTIQIGVYRQVSAAQLLNLRPVFRESIANGLFRFTAGSYNNADRVIADKQKVVALGIRDAFVSAYINGKRVPFSEARQRQQTDATIRTGAENPVILDNTTQPPTQIESAQPFSNNVQSYPPATPENGVKTTEEGITFKVQIGAFSRQVPEDVADRFSQIRDWPVENKRVNDLFIYNIGNFSEARFARDLKDEAVRLGITDAFVTVYRDGRKLYGADAAALLSR